MEVLELDKLRKLLNLAKVYSLFYCVLYDLLVLFLAKLFI